MAFLSAFAAALAAGRQIRTSARDALAARVSICALEAARADAWALEAVSATLD